MAQPDSLRLLGEAPPPARDVPAFLAKGFRPFFLLAALFAMSILPVWLLALAGVVQPDSYLDPTYWHAHEMIFGFVVAVIAGFLLTAVSNWTGRETASGWGLTWLVLLWSGGRLVLASPHLLPRGLVAAVDVAFLPALAFAIGRPLLRAKSRRNYPVLAVVVALGLLDLAIHLDALGVVVAWRRRASLVAVDVVVLLVLFMAGRIFPMFTRNATRVQTIRNLPALDWCTAGCMLALAVTDLVRPDARLGAALAGLTAVLAAARAVTWGAHHTLRIPLVWILHASHAWIVVGLALRALSAVTDAVPTSSALHALTVGGIGAATIGMMARVALGHTGRALTTSKLVTASFVLVTIAAAARVVGPFVLAWYRPSLYVAGVAWTCAFAAYVVAYAPVLATRRLDGKPG